MLKKTITFTNFNDQEVTEDHYFHFSQADLVDMELEYEGGYSKMLEQLIATQDGAKIMATFKEIIAKSYGKKSDDGNRFIKSPDLTEAFMSSEAYSTLFMELVTDSTAAAEFVNGLLPKGMKQQLEQAQQDKPNVTPIQGGPQGVRNGVRQGEETPTTPEVREVTRAEAAAMDSAEFNAGVIAGTIRIKEDME